MVTTAPTAGTMNAAQTRRGWLLDWKALRPTRANSSRTVPARNIPDPDADVVAPSALERQARRPRRAPPNDGGQPADPERHGEPLRVSEAAVRPRRCRWASNAAEQDVGDVERAEGSLLEERRELLAVARAPRRRDSSGAGGASPAGPARAAGGRAARTRRARAAARRAPSRRRAVSRYGRRRSTGARASIRPRSSSRASAAYRVPGPMRPAGPGLDVGHDRVAVLRPVGQADEDQERGLGEPAEVGDAGLSAGPWDSTLTLCDISWDVIWRRPA